MQQAAHISHGHDCPFRLCEHEKADVRAVARESFATCGFPTIEEAEKIFGASLLLKKILGPDWVSRNVHPEIPRIADAYFRQSFRSPEEKAEWIYRLICLANLFHELVRVPGLEGRVQELMTKSIEEVVFELRMAQRLIDSGHHVHFVDPTSATGKIYDLDVGVGVHRRHVAVEIKCKMDDTPFTPNTLRNTLADARGQLPKNGPGAIMVKLPRPWLLDPAVMESVHDGVNAFLRNSRRVNAVLTYFETLTVGPPPLVQHAGVFAVMLNTSPRVPVEGLYPLLRPGDGKPTPTPVLFL